MKVPPVVFDIGAQAERVRRAGFGFVLPYPLIDDIQRLNDRLLALPLAERPVEKPTDDTHYPSILRDYYGIETSGGRRHSLDAVLKLSQ